MADTAEFPCILLEGCALLPFQLLPLHLFEPRYRKMAEAALAGDRRFAVGEAIVDAEGKETAGPWATLGRILSHEPLDGGRHLVLLEGETRLRVAGLSARRPFPTLLAHAVPDEDAGPDAHVALARATATVERTLPRLMDAEQVNNFLPRLLQLAASHPGRFADAAAGHLLTDPELRRKLIAQTHPVVRLRALNAALLRMEAELGLPPTGPGFDARMN